MHGPMGGAFGRLATHHSDHPLLWLSSTTPAGPGALLLEKRRFQHAALVKVTDIANSSNDGFLEIIQAVGDLVVWFCLNDIA
jgi:hypothetical protein